MTESLPKAYKIWIVASVALLVFSLLLLAISVGAAFFYFSGGVTPVWVVVLGGLAVFGILAGFGGFLTMMGVAGWRSFREARRVQVLPPEHSEL